MPARSEQPITPDEIQDQLKLILERQDVFSVPPGLASFIRHVVNETLAGNHVSGDTIVSDLFSGTEEREHEEKNTARHTAGRARSRLDKYYAGPSPSNDYKGGPGRNDPIIISIPKGGFQASFVRRPSIQSYHSSDPPQQLPPISSIEQVACANVTSRGSGLVEDIDEMVRQLREKTLAGIEDGCGKVRIFSIERRVKLNDIYTDVYVHERRISDVLRHPAEADHRKRVNGLKVFARDHRVVIYGQPGSGKTMFLNRLAVECATGRFKSDLVPIFITLREFADPAAVAKEAGQGMHFEFEKGGPTTTLFGFIQNEIWRCDENTARAVLAEGRALVLLDGLDEVGDKHFAHNAIQTFADTFHRCSIALTCRIGGVEQALDRFSEVEIANLNRSQIEALAVRFFRAHVGRLGKQLAQIFLQRNLRESRLLELASKPLFLSLLCMVFCSSVYEDFVGTEAELYKRCLAAIWEVEFNPRKAIVRKLPYNLTPKDIETLLGEIAYRGFLASSNLDHSTLHDQIEMFCKEPDRIDRHPEFGTATRMGWRLIAERVLNAIESQSGLLIRTGSTYSFLHLTFQEYFVAQRVADDYLAAKRDARESALLSEIAPHVGDAHWREVFLGLVVIVENADDVVLKLKEGVDALVKKEPEIQKYLEWCRTNAAAQFGGYRPSALRALFFDRGFKFYPTPTLSFRLDISLFRAVYQILQSTIPFACTLANACGLELELPHLLGAFDLDGLLYELPDRMDYIVRVLNEILTGLDEQIRELDQNPTSAHGLREFRETVRAVPIGLDFARFEEIVASPTPEFIALLELRPQQYEQVSSAAWLEKTEAAALKRRDRGKECCHGCEFDVRQEELVRIYHEANLFLLECMDRARGLSLLTRQHIEDSMVLPWNEIPLPTALPRQP